MWSPSVPGVFTLSLEPKISCIGSITMREAAPSSEACSFSLALEKAGKDVTMVVVDPVPDIYRFLTGSDRMVHYSEVKGRYDAVFFLDCGDLERTGPAAALAELAEIKVNIDHHISNPRYGAVNLVLDQTAATAEILYQFFIEDNFAIDKHVATCLLAGVYTDTDAFTNLGTTPESLAVASELLKLGANFRDLTANTMRNKSLASLKLWGRALERLRLDTHKGIAVTVLKDSDFGECGAEPDDAEGVASLLNHLADVKMSMLLRELPDGTVKGSLRTTNELIDVSQVATLMGGGGHAKAAGFTVKGRIAETENGWKIIE